MKKSQTIIEINKFECSYNNSRINVKNNQSPNYIKQRTNYWKNKERNASPQV